MAKKVQHDSSEEEHFIKGGKTIIETPLEDEVSKSYLDYAYSVIHSRALPDARDGLKPVHRRILYTMYEDGLNPSHSHVKSARVVGNTLGRYHPHGDSSVYEAMVRLAQDFSLNTPLVDGHGNFGSPNDSPAAARYCLVGSTRIRTPHLGTVTIADLAGNIPPDSETNVDFDVYDKDGKRVRVSKVFNSGVWPVLKVETVEGYSITGSENHLVLALLAPFGVPIFQWVRLDEIVEGTLVAVPTNVWEESLPSHLYNEKSDRTSVSVTTEGVLKREGSVCFNSDGTPSCDDLGVPKEVWRGNTETKRAYLREAFSHPAKQKKGQPFMLYAASKCETCISTTQTLLLEFGVVSSRKLNKAGSMKGLVVSGEHFHHFITRIGEPFPLTLNVPTETTSGGTVNMWGVLNQENLYNEVPFVKEYLLSEVGHGKKGWLRKAPIANLTFWKMNTPEILSKVHNDEAVRVVEQIMSAGYYFAEVKGVTSAGSEQVYSLKVESDNHSFLAGPFINHNTEARMSKHAMHMVEELKEETVNFAPNYDGSLDEPIVMPAGFPNLLINGTTGIAVGMATNMIPHNPGEVMAGARALLKKPTMSVEDLMVYIPGPDLPTGGLLLGMDEVKSAYETGRGKVIIRAKATIEPLAGSRGRNSIVFTELPYQVGTEKIIESIKTEIGKKKLQGISDVKDLSDRKNGIRLVVECKTGVNPTTLLNELYQNTPLSVSFSINNLTLVKGKPETLSLKGLLQVFLEHRIDVVTRRTQYRLAKAEARKHIVEGLLIALANVEEIVRIIRRSADTAEAKQKLMQKYKLSDIQTQHILEMPLRRLVNLEVETLKKEHVELLATIKALNLILDDEKVLKKTIDDELAVVQKNITQDRKTELVGASLQEATEALKAVEPLEVADEPCTVHLSASHLLIRSPGATEDTSHAKTPRRGDRRHEIAVSSATSTTRGNILAITNTGKAFRVRTITIPPHVSGAKHVSASSGVRAKEVLPIAPNETVIAIVPETVEGGKGVALGTKQGVVKICQPDWPGRADEFEIIKLKPGDEVIGASWCSDNDTVVFVVNTSNLLRYPTASVRAQGRSGGGMAGVRLSAEDKVLTFSVTEGEGEGYEVYTYTGYSGKRTPLTEYPTKGRGTGGVRSHKFLKGETDVVLARVVKGEAMSTTPDGKEVDLSGVSGRRDGSGKPLPESVETIGTPIG